ncbi:LysM peptidoglycan-binding domain-containing protein [Candidatus Zixiibacteriota bacterium]
MSLVKAKITVEHTAEEIDVMFNPKEYTLNQDNNFASQAVPGLQAPLLQFVHGNMRTLEMELFFDTYEAQRDVRDETQRIIRLLEIDAELHAPPILVISWATLYFRCVLARANQKFIMFLPDGRPVRARVTVTFNEFIDPELESKEVNRQTVDFSKVHIVAQKETISGIAGKYYENPRMWRAIATVNGIDDPRSITIGQPLRIPPLPFEDPESGEVLR